MTYDTEYHINRFLEVKETKRFVKKFGIYHPEWNKQQWQVDKKLAEYTNRIELKRIIHLNIERIKRLKK